MRPHLIRIGKITAAHGIKGFVKCQSYTEIPARLADYSPLTDKAGGRCLEIVSCQPTAGKDIFLVSFKDVTTRTQAEQLAGLDLFVPSDRLPEPKEGEFYYEDLLQTEAYLPNGEKYGVVSQIYDFGAGTVLEIKKADGGEILLPFNGQTVSEVNVEAKRLTLTPPSFFDIKETKKAAEREEGTSRNRKEARR